MIKKLVAAAALMAAVTFPAAASPDIGKEAPKLKGKTLTGGPQMLQLSLDGKRPSFARAVRSRRTPTPCQ